MNVNEIIEKIGPLFDVHNDDEHVEVEMRLGRKVQGAFFDTNVTKPVFDKAMRALRKFKGWETIRTSTADVFYHDAGGIRLSVDCETGEQIMVQKLNLAREDFVLADCPLDLRFSISKEIPASGEYEMDRKRSKHRYSFVRKNLSIDLTVSSGDTVDKDDEDPNTYQIELEIVDPGAVACQEELFNIVHKVNDLFACL